VCPRALRHVKRTVFDSKSRDHRRDVGRQFGVEVSRTNAGTRDDDRTV
jgi:hypothetical protein